MQAIQANVAIDGIPQHLKFGTSLLIQIIASNLMLMPCPSQACRRI
jgi:hypothetical protein